jgi:hypothetical protein
VGCCTRSLKSAECRIDRRLPFASKPGVPRAETRPLTGGAVRRKLASGQKRIYAGERAFVLHSLAAELPWKSRSRYDELVSGRTVYTYVGNDPINKTDLSGLAPGDPFDSAEAAGVDAANSVTANSKSGNTEYGGAVYKGPDGKYYAQDPVKGKGDNVTWSYKGPKGSISGDYHTHGDYSKKDNKGEPERSDKSHDQYNSDNFSQPDKDNSQDLSKKSGEKDGYRSVLGTPSGDVKVYIIQTRGKLQPWRPLRLRLRLRLRHLQRVRTTIAVSSWLMICD